MTRTVLVLAALLALLSRWAGATAFVNVNVVDMLEGAIVGAQTVVVSDGVIAAIGPVERTQVPEGHAVVDGTDRYLMPGLAEMHAHIPGAESDSLERILTLFVANGVTSVRGMLGQPSHLALREALEAGEVFGPRLYTSGPSFNGGSVDGARQATRMVREQYAAGYDFLKIHPGLTRAEFRAVAEAAIEHGLRFAGHVPAEVGLPLALESGISTIDHLDGYLQALVPPDVDPSGGYDGFFGLLLAPAAEASRIDGLALATQAAGAWNVPTQALFEHYAGPEPAAALAGRPEMRYMPADTVARWVASKEELLAEPGYSAATAERAIRLRRELILALERHGGLLLLGSDAPQVFNVPGFSLHRELALLVESGLTPHEALLSGTVNAARWFGWSDRLGTLDTGKQADLLLLDDDPLVDVANAARIHGVMLRGRWLDRGELDRRLARWAR